VDGFSILLTTFYRREGGFLSGLKEEFLLFGFHYRSTLDVSFGFGKIT